MNLLQSALYVAVIVFSGIGLYVAARVVKLDIQTWIAVRAHNKRRRAAQRAFDTRKRAAILRIDAGDCGEGCAGYCQIVFDTTQGVPEYGIAPDGGPLMFGYTTAELNDVLKNRKEFQV